MWANRMVSGARDANRTRAGPVAPPFDAP
jgi:hypothetical protein